MVPFAGGDGPIEGGTGAEDRTFGAEEPSCGKVAGRSEGWPAGKVVLATKLVRAAVSRLDGGDIAGARELLVALLGADE